MLIASKVVLYSVARGRSSARALRGGLRRVAAGQVDVAPLVHDRFALDEGLAAFARARERGCLKVLLDMGAGT